MLEDKEPLVIAIQAVQEAGFGPNYGENGSRLHRAFYVYCYDGVHVLRAKDTCSR